MQNINTLKTIWYSQDFNIEKKLKLVNHSIISGLANTNYWEKIITNVLLIRNEKLPSEAIKSLVVGPSILECASVLMLTLYLYILNNYGDDNFNLIFSKPALKFILQNSFISPLEPVERTEITFGLGNPLHFLFDVIEPKYENLQNNDFVYIEGVQEYKYKHLVGDFIGYNLLCVKNGDDIKFIGFGDSIFNKKPLSLEELRIMFVNEFNKEQSPATKFRILKFSDPVNISDTSFGAENKFTVDVAKTFESTIYGLDHQIGGVKHILRLNQDRLKKFMENNFENWLTKQNITNGKLIKKNIPIQFLVPFAPDTGDKDFSNYDTKTPIQTELLNLCNNTLYYQRETPEELITTI